MSLLQTLLLRLKAHQLERAIRNCCEVAADHRAQALYYEGRLLPALSLQLANTRLKLGKPATAKQSRPLLGQFESFRAPKPGEVAMRESDASFLQACDVRAVMTSHRGCA